jgi:membrane-bound lytic murein transglycosylase F
MIIKFFKIFLRTSHFLRLTSLFLVSTFLLSGCYGDKEKVNLQKILEQGYITVGTLYGPSSYFIGKDGPAGFEYELAKKYADSLGVELKVVPSYNLNDLFPQLDSGEVDFLAAGLSVTPERLKKYHFSPSYDQASQKVVFKQGKKRPRELKDLSGTLMVTANSSHVENLKILQKSYSYLTWLETGDLDAEELLLQVLDEKVDYTIIDSNILAINRRYYPEISIAFTIKQAEPLAWVVNKTGDDSIFASLIEFFGVVHHNGTLLALNDKYYGHVEDFDYVDTRLFIKAIATELPKYKALFQKYAQNIDWRLLAAISYQESHWKPNARSYTGVRGMMMLTLPTAKQMGVKSRLDPEQSIQGGAKYFKKMINKMPERIKDPDRIWFALASYNIGFGHLNDARIITQRKGEDPDRWVDVKENLPLLKRKKYYKRTKYGYARGDEAVKYVDNIRRYYDTLVWVDEQKTEPPEELLSEISTENSQ